MPRRQLFALTLLAAMTIAAYLPVVKNGFVWDDDHYVTTHVQGQQRTLRDLGKVWTDPSRTPQYYPLVHTMFWVEYHLWGLDPLGYHLVNVALQAATACLLYLVLKRLKLPGGRATAWVAAAVWAVHPMGVESVAWATERKNVLSATLAMGAFLALLRFYRIGDASSPAAPSGESENEQEPDLACRWLLPALALFIAALLAKTVVSTLPAVAVLVLWWKRRSFNRRTLLPLTPFFVLGIALGQVTAYQEVHHVGAIGPDWTFSPVEHVLIAGRIAWFYVGKFLWPHPLVFIYPRWTIDATAWQQYLFPAAVMGVPLILLALLRRLGRGPLAGTLIFGVMLLPALGFFPVYPMRFSFVADHFAYLALAALAALVTAAGYTLLRPLNRPAVQAIAAAAAILVLITLTWLRVPDYRDERTLWMDTYRKNPRSMIANTNLAYLLFDAGKPDEAIRYVKELVDLDPQRTFAWDTAATIMLRAHRNKEALPYLERCIELFGSAHPPERGGAESKIGLAYQALGDWADAEPHYRLALIDAPWNPEAGLGLGQCLIRKHEYAEAATVLREHVKHNPGSGLGFFNFGAALEELGQTNAAIEAFQQAVRLLPRPTTRMRLGQALAKLGRYNEAAGQFQAVTRETPDDAEAQLDLGAAISEMGYNKEAVEPLEKAAELTKNKDSRPLEALARARAALGDYSAAAAAARLALAAAQEAGQSQAAARIGAMLAAYQAGKPWSESPATTAAAPGD